MTDNRDSAPTVTERVAAGVALLDREQPGWDSKVNLDTLNIASSWNCVLGQLYGDELTGGKALDLKWVVAVRCGFDRHSGELRVVFDELTDEWKRVISERRAAVA